MTIYQDLMTDHEEEILKHLTTLDYDNADVAKAYKLLPINQAIHTLTTRRRSRSRCTCRPCSRMCSSR